MTSENKTAAKEGRHDNGASSGTVRADRWAMLAAPVVVAMRRKGMSIRAIAIALNAQGIPPRFGSRWQPSTVSAVIRRAASLDESLADLPGMVLPSSTDAAVRRGHEVQHAEADDWARSMRPIIEEMLARGLSYGRCADELNDRGIPARRGGRWFRATVRNVVVRVPGEPAAVDSAAPPRGGGRIDGHSFALLIGSAPRDGFERVVLSGGLPVPDARGTYGAGEVGACLAAMGTAPDDDRRIRVFPCETC